MFDVTHWLNSTALEPLDVDHVHIWRASLKPSPATIVQCQLVLSEDEMARANRLHSDTHRQRAIITRGIVRRILCQYLDMAPTEVMFQTTRYGKPYIVPAQNQRGVMFNISHSEDMLLVGIARGHSIGVDVEAIRPLSGLRGLSRMAFSQREQQSFAILPVRRQIPTFFGMWTQKEAFVKAIGTGLSFGLQTVEVMLDTERHAALLRIDNQRIRVSDWTIKRVRPRRGYIGAVVVHGTRMTFKHYTYSSDMLD